MCGWCVCVWMKKYIFATLRFCFRVFFSLSSSPSHSMHPIPCIPSSLLFRLLTNVLFCRLFIYLSTFLICISSVLDDFILIYVFLLFPFFDTLFLLFLFCLPFVWFAVCVCVLFC